MERWLEKHQVQIAVPAYVFAVAESNRAAVVIVTRNHQCRYMWLLLDRVKQCMNAISSLPGNQQLLVKVEQ